MFRRCVSLGLAAAILSGVLAGPGVTADGGPPGNDACQGGVRAGPGRVCRILLFTRTADIRHANLGPPLPGGLNPTLDESHVVQRGLLALAGRNGWRLDYTEDLAAMKDLRAYDAVVFFSTSGEVLDRDARIALRRYLRGGGGFVAVHNAVAAMSGWSDYGRLLGGVRFAGHGPLRVAQVVVSAPGDASIRGLPPRFAFRDEWYDLSGALAASRVLAIAEEAAGAPRPVAWCHRYGGGRVWVTTLGHEPGVFSGGENLPGAGEFRALLAGGIRSAMGAAPFCD